MRKFIHTKQRKAALATVIRGYNYNIRRASALKAHGKYQGVVLPKLLNVDKEFAKITTLEEYNELINRVRETTRATREEKIIQLGKYKTIETQTTRIIKNSKKEVSRRSFEMKRPPKLNLNLRKP